MSTSSARLPSSPFPLLPLRNGVLFPGTIITLPVGRERSVALARQLSKGDLLGVATQKDPAVELPGRPRGRPGPVRRPRRRLAGAARR
jgi:ATP-dependent Lon protease